MTVLSMTPWVRAPIVSLVEGTSWRQRSAEPLDPRVDSGTAPRTWQLSRSRRAGLLPDLGDDRRPTAAMLRTGATQLRHPTAQTAELLRDR
jgi:hypothetical protein